MSTERKAELLRRRVYRLAEVARLIGRQNDTVKRWITGKHPLYVVDNNTLFDFYDLISLWVVSRLRRKKVPYIAIITGRNYLSDKLGTRYPFVHHKGIVALGRFFFERVENRWVGLDKSGCSVFQTVIEQGFRPVDTVSEELCYAYEQEFKPMEFGDDQMAKAWIPYPGVRVDPKVQSGQPCLKGTRVPALMIADLVEKSGGESWYELIAEDYQLKKEQIKAAVGYGNLVRTRSI